ncbi:unnamed protein product [Mytilus coruscus]|uniref:Uncharacterized protein n=1 Tax=Mytilus coruscus TaxID=42192 RepID=A0A6J8A7H5_MYTCO|nr:unnamed protein product [Mytilus coruscus]
MAINKHCLQTINTQILRTRVVIDHQNSNSSETTRVDMHTLINAPTPVNNPNTSKGQDNRNKKPQHSHIQQRPNLMESKSNCPPGTIQPHQGISHDMDKTNLNPIQITSQEQNVVPTPNMIQEPKNCFLYHAQIHQDPPDRALLNLENQSRISQ